MSKWLGFQKIKTYFASNTFLLSAVLGVLGLYPESDELISSSTLESDFPLLNSLSEMLYYGLTKQIIKINKDINISQSPLFDVASISLVGEDLSQFALSFSVKIMYHKTKRFISLNNMIKNFEQFNYC